MTQDVLVDPRQQSFDQASRDPLDVLTSNERLQAQQLINQGDNKATIVQAALLVTRAFLLYRAFAYTRMFSSISATVDQALLRSDLDFHWHQYATTWVLTTTQPLTAAGRAALDIRNGDLPETVLEAMAEDYATRLGAYIHDSTKEALIEGFTANLNKRLPRQVAARKALDGLGLNQRQMRALVARKAPIAINSTRQLNPDADTNEFITRALLSRAHEIGTEETFKVSQEGRQLGWLFQVSKGMLPADTQRMWLTARDEKVCKVCGPMNRKTVLVTEMFELPDKRKLWSPGVHPNCRCEMKLKVPVVQDAFLRKDLSGGARSAFNRKHPRDKGGRFAEVDDKPTKNLNAELIEQTMRNTVQQSVELAKPVDLSRGTLTPVEFAKPVAFAKPVTIKPVEFHRPVEFEPGGFAPATFEPTSFAPVELTTKAVEIAVAAGVELKRKADLDLGKQFDEPVPLDYDEEYYQETRRIGGVAGYFDAENLPWLDTSEIGTDDFVEFDDSHEFTTKANNKEMIELSYKKTEDNEVRRIVAQGTTSLKDPDTGHQINRLTPEYIRTCVRMELLGATDKPFERKVAQKLGVVREAHISSVWLIDEAYVEGMDSGTGREFDVFPGVYKTAMIEEPQPEGYPVRYVWIRPITTSEYLEHEANQA